MTPSPALPLVRPAVQQRDSREAPPQPTPVVSICPAIIPRDIGAAPSPARLHHPKMMGEGEFQMKKPAPMVFGPPCTTMAGGNS